MNEKTKRDLEDLELNWFNFPVESSEIVIDESIKITNDFETLFKELAEMWEKHVYKNPLKLKNN